MNQAARDALINAAMVGTPQTFGMFVEEDDAGHIIGQCGLAVLGFDDETESKEWVTLAELWGLSLETAFCPECNMSYPDEATLVAHLNDTHNFDFITIARKMP